MPMKITRSTESLPKAVPETTLTSLPADMILEICEHAGPRAAVCCAVANVPYILETPALWHKFYNQHIASTPRKNLEGDNWRARFAEAATQKACEERVIRPRLAPLEALCKGNGSGAVLVSFPDSSLTQEAGLGHLREVAKRSGRKMEHLSITSSNMATELPRLSQGSKPTLCVIEGLEVTEHAPHRVPSLRAWLGQPLRAGLVVVGLNHDHADEADATWLRLMPTHLDLTLRGVSRIDASPNV